MDELLAAELSADTMAALQAHLLERSQENDVMVSEDFRLSQLCVVKFLRRHDGGLASFHSLAANCYSSLTCVLN